MIRDSGVKFLTLIKLRYQIITQVTNLDFIRNMIIQVLNSFALLRSLNMTLTQHKHNHMFSDKIFARCSFFLYGI